jgi:P27 family predicted phage terminase small subunit
MVKKSKSSTNRKVPKVTQKSAADAQSVAVLDLECPSELSPVAQQKWNSIVGELNALDVVRRFDRGLLAAYCTAYALALEAIEAIGEYGMMIKSPNGHPMQSPCVSIFNQQVDVMLRVGKEFGFTPASRGQIQAFLKQDSTLIWPDFPERS